MTKPRQRGFTLIELIIFIVVVSIGLAGILSVINTVVKSSADPMVRKQTIAIAESLLEEILLKDYADPSGGTNGVSTCTLASGQRFQWNSVCDYNGYTTTGIMDMLGTVVPPLSSYNITAVTVAPSSDLTGLSSSKVKKVTVLVTGPQGSISLTGYRAKDQ